MCQMCDPAEEFPHWFFQLQLHIPPMEHSLPSSPQAQTLWEEQKLRLVSAAGTTLLQLVEAPIEHSLLKYPRDRIQVYCHLHIILANYAKHFLSPWQYYQNSFQMSI